MSTFQMLSESRFSKVVDYARNKFSSAIKKLGYDFWDEMMDNEIAKSSRPEVFAVDWYRKNYAQNKDQMLKAGFMKAGRLYLFMYTDPKFKKELEFYDKQPLVLCLGTYKTIAGEIRSIGINMHLLPPKVRRLVMFTIFNTYKTSFKRDLYADNKKDISVVKWQTLARTVEKYGAAFAFRMYIPDRQKYVVEFKTEDMPKAIWIPSAGYVRTNPVKLQKAWKEYLTKHSAINKIVGGNNHDKAV